MDNLCTETQHYNVQKPICNVLVVIDFMFYMNITIDIDIFGECDQAEGRA